MAEVGFELLTFTFQTSTIEDLSPGTRFLPFRPLLCNGEKSDFVYLVATMPGRHSGDQVHKVKKTAAPSFLHFTASGMPRPLLIGADTGVGPRRGTARALHLSAPFLCKMGEKSTLLCDSPQCRGGIVSL